MSTKNDELKGSNEESESERSYGPVVFNLKHGGHILIDKSERTKQLARTQESVTMAAEGAVIEFSTPFYYLFPKLEKDSNSHLPADDPAKVVTNLKALADAMLDAGPTSREDLQPTDNSIIPPVYTYWGQFIDHDLTANTDRDTPEISDITRDDLKPLPPDFVTEHLKNLRQPTLNLDSVYGDGPTFDRGRRTKAAGFYQGAKLRVGAAATENTNPERPIPGDRIPPADDLQRDLPRIGALLDAGVISESDFSDEEKEEPFRTRAFIGDSRNDENLIIAQFHTAFLRFHNNVVDWVAANDRDSKKNDAKLFRRARRLTRWHYQWLVVHDYLKTVTLSGVVDKVLLGGPKHYKPRNGKLFMPLEFSVAAYRFGHTMVRAVYDHNRNFGRPGNVIPTASFDLLFLFTGKGFARNRPPSPPGVTLSPFGGSTATLPFNWIIEWDRFVDKGSAVPDHFARKIDTHLAPPLHDIVNEGNRAQLSADISKLLKQLARRNLLRGYLLSIPTGQSVADEMKVPRLTPEELQQGNPAVAEALKAGGFLERTPLWFYVLKEAEVRANGNSLGELGSRIVCETIIGLLFNDPDSYLNRERGWEPSKGVKLPNGDPIVTIRDFLKFAGLPA